MLMCIGTFLLSAFTFYDIILESLLWNFSLNKRTEASYQHVVNMHHITMAQNILDSVWQSKDCYLTY